MDENWKIKWLEDIEQIKNELPKCHKNLYFQNSEVKFFKDIEVLENIISKLNHFNVICEIGKIIARFGDAHTTLMLPGKWFLPFEFYWFEEGIYIIGAIEKYKAMLNKKVTHINGIPIEKVIRSLESIISHENEQFVKSQLPKYLKVAEVLFGLGLITDLQVVEIQIDNRKFSIETIENMKKEQLYPAIVESLGTYNLPLYRQKKDKNYWWDYLNNDKTIYINYNCCKDMSSQIVAEFDNELRTFIDNNDVADIVIDLRNNLGGDSTLFESFIKWLKIWVKGAFKRQVFTIIGRDTFSSALLNAYSLKNDVGAAILGEGSGGKPNCYGEVRYFELENSKLKIRYSTKYYKIIEDDEQLSLYPGISFKVSFKDYIECKDPVLEYILSR